jgi:hypothetical protein
MRFSSAGRLADTFGEAFETRSCENPTGRPPSSASIVTSQGSSISRRWIPVPKAFAQCASMFSGEFRSAKASRNVRSANTASEGASCRTARRSVTMAAA